jgi:aerobic-type carbon monoxide dehydrogenase small subunit (CoxS/CutS family)
MRAVTFTLNGQPTSLTVDGQRPLLWVLRDDLGLTGTKYGCGESVCGACTVLVNDEAVRACSTPVSAVAGKRVVTIEGLAQGDTLHPLQQAFVEHLGFQCGFCTPGMILGAYALLRRPPKPSRADVVRHMEPHLCRCGAHVRILDAIEAASAVVQRSAR